MIRPSTFQHRQVDVGEVVFKNIIFILTILQPLRDEGRATYFTPPCPDLPSRRYKDGQLVVKRDGRRRYD